MAENVELAENRTFPPPPPFYKSFTKSNLDALKELQAGAKGTDGGNAPLSTSERLQSLQTPDELRFLIPPIPPKTEEKYRVFTSELDVSLPPEHVRRQLSNYCTRSLELSLASPHFQSSSCSRLPQSPLRQRPTLSGPSIACTI